MTAHGGKGGDEAELDSLDAGPRQRELTEPSERSQPVPLLVAAMTVVMATIGAAYIVLAEPPGPSLLGDRRTEAALRGASTSMHQSDGKQLFAANCAGCHQIDGRGLPGVFPPLAGSEWVNGDPTVVANILLHGIDGDIDVAGHTYHGAMPSFARLSDGELAGVASYVRGAWSNASSPLENSVVTAARASDRKTPFTGGAELKTLGGTAR